MPTERLARMDGTRTIGALGLSSEKIGAAPKRSTIIILAPLVMSRPWSTGSMIAALFAASFDFRPITFALVAFLEGVLGSGGESEYAGVEQGKDADDENDKGGFEVEHGFL